MKKNIILFLAVILLAIFPLFIHKESEFGGADGQAQEAISEINGSYTPWFESIWEPPGGETESLLFVLQGAAGAGFIGYFIGFMRGKNKTKEIKKGKNKYAINR
ncbi:energy-coupling factor ABC transporter substrate-binding protein [Bacillus tuaregi]|uniref:energy-coupling factor ABC transporter substrate-binding protein n=1 Tax=Bacillus tuaregi TaxID=1816695 RepID=UPI0008F96C7B|nr:energy-coupling factor ABC transporter substrate-binding protein [Bacillus tuaregi]